ncbi:MAG: hypothetical protein HUJ26_07810 [Planctomycetaceae bacterium]|nr:hypothetical protein [Planctomycetaceae bacterium]
MRFPRQISSLLVIVAFLMAGSSLSAALPREAKEKVGDIRSQLTEVTKLLRDDKFDEAKEILDESETALDSLGQELGSEYAEDRTLLSAKKYLFDQKARYLKEKGVSFAKDVAPIFVENCARCHINNNSGGLSLACYADMAKGGRSGPLLVPGSSRRSLLMAKLVHPDDAQRMPKNGNQLADEDLLVISTWIDLRAPYDGDDPMMALGDLIRSANRGGMAKIDIPMATGKETVSFSNDIAPFMSRLCLGCHSGNNPDGGLSLETFERLMEGGDSGRVIIPGNRNGSRLFRLVGGLENPRMPQGQARITRQNYEDLKTWFDEGNKFDGDNIKTPLRQLVPSEDEMKMEELAKLTPEEWEELRIERSQDQWKRTLPKEPGARLEGKEFLIWSNAGTDRMNQVERLAGKHFTQLKALFDDKNEERTFPGRLTIFLFKDRIGYEEFLFTIERQRPEQGMVAHTKVTPTLEDAYIALEDVGDDPGAGQMNLETSLATQLATAYLKKQGGDLPGWVTQGAGLYLAAQSGDADYFRSLPSVAAEAIRELTRPQQLFADGAFSPTDEAAVGYTLVGFLIKNGGAQKFGQFISRMKNGSSVDAALTAVYRSNAQAIAVAYARALGNP